MLLALTSFAGNNKEAEGFTYIRYCQIVGEDDAVSRAQFFKSIDVLLASKVVLKIGLPRAATYSSALKFTLGSFMFVIHSPISIFFGLKSD